jgi:hypothetical protein
MFLPPVYIQANANSQPFRKSIVLHEGYMRKDTASTSMIRPPYVTITQIAAIPYALT